MTKSISDYIKRLSMKTLISSIGVLVTGLIVFLCSLMWTTYEQVHDNTLMLSEISERLDNKANKRVVNQRLANTERNVNQNYISIRRLEDRLYSGDE